MAKRDNKKPSSKRSLGPVWREDGWNVVWGRLVPSRGRPKKVSHLFEVIGEKLPYKSLGKVKKAIEEEELSAQGVYMAHDSMGVARYGGRGDIFSRLATHRRKYPNELLYFSFYIISNKPHEREIETAILRAAGGQMVLNERKVRMGLKNGNVSDYEPGTWYFERQMAKGRRKKRRK